MKGGEKSCIRVENSQWANKTTKRQTFQGQKEGILLQGQYLRPMLQMAVYILTFFDLKW